jgi:SSS family transporter
MGAVEGQALPSLPGVGVAAPVVGVIDDSLIIAGGASFSEGPFLGSETKVWHDEILRLNRPNGEWDVIGRLPRPMAYGVSVTHGNSIICVGGSDEQHHYSDAFRIEIRGQDIMFHPLPPLPVAMAKGAGVVLNEKLYIVAGTGRPDDSTLEHGFWALDLKQIASGWRQLPAWPGPSRIYPVVAAQDGAFYLFSGIERSPAPGVGAGAVGRHLRDGYRFDPTTEGWTRTSDLPRPAAAAPSPAMVLGQSSIVVFGGDDGTSVNSEPVSEQSEFNPTLLCYHTITDTWRPLGELPYPRVTTQTVQWRDAWVVAGGAISPGIISQQVWAFKAPNAQMQLGWLNTFVILIYLGGVVWIGWACSRSNESTDDFFRGGQRIPWWAAGLSIFATMLSSITFMAIPANAYHSGWALFLANSYILITPLVVFVFLPFYRRLNVTSAYEYLERRFDTATRLAGSTLFILFQCGRIAIVLYLPALAVATVTDLNVQMCILVMGGLCIAYTAAGGIKAVIWTDVVQAVLLGGAALVSLSYLLSQTNGGLSGALSIASEHGRLFEKVDWSWDVGVASGWVILIGSLFHHMFPLTASQDVVQRYITTKDEANAARAIWLNSFVSVAATATFFLIGSALFAYFRQYPERLDPTLRHDAIFPFFVISALPVGIAGLVIAGILAAAQSTLSSSINSIATAVVTDFQHRIQPGRSDKHYLRSARWVSLVVGVIGTGIAQVMAITDIRSLYTSFLEIIGLFGGTLSGLFVLGVFSSRASARGALAGAVVSCLLLIYIRQNYLLNAYAYAPIGLSTCVVIGWLVSFIWPERKNLSGLTISG